MNDYSHTFSLDEVRAFGSLSGDLNPIHVDPVAARRLVFGAAAVHGVFVLCQVMEYMARDKLPIGHLSFIKAHFRQPVAVGETVNIGVTTNAAGAQAKVSGGEAVSATLEFKFESPDISLSRPGLDRPALQGLPKLLTEQTIAAARGNIPLGYSHADFAKMFPALSSTVPDLWIGCLLGLTRIVGMECPGERSVFSGFEAKFSGVDGADKLSYEVSRWDDRLNLATIAITGASVTANVEALLRPLPARQPSMDELKPFVTGKPFHGQRALVVGGSRGLGEVCARLLALGGAKEICLTYAAGKVDAEKVAQSLSGHVSVRVASFDVLEDTAPDGDFDCVYYFAAPRIRPNRNPFNKEQYRLYGGYFVEGMASLFLSYVRKNPVRFMQPSSVFVETPEPWFLEYAAAKAAAENLAVQLMNQYPSSRVLTPRLPRVYTDQTQGNSECAGAAETLMPILMNFKEN